MVTKPKKPTPDLPLFSHTSGQWAKKIKGRMHYFGPWKDPQVSLAKYLALDEKPVSDKITSGEKPRKPRKDFPLFARASGQWAKKVRGRLVYSARGPTRKPRSTSGLIRRTISLLVALQTVAKDLRFLRAAAHVSDNRGKDQGQGRRPSDHGARRSGERYERSLLRRANRRCAIAVNVRFCA
jgi:hypothetical protein